MAVSGYTIWHINQEFPQHAWAKDLGQLGSLIIGRPWGQTIWISEFYGRVNEYRYGIGFYEGWNQYIFGTPWGGVETWSGGGATTSIMMYTDGGGAAAWPHLLRVEISSYGTIYPGSFTHLVASDNGRPFAHWNYYAYIPNGTITWVFL